MSHPKRSSYNDTASISSIVQQLGISLGDNYGLTSFPWEVLQLKQLRQLYLNDHKLDTLPPEISNLAQLEHLNLGTNNISSIPAKIGELKKLKSLWLNDNPLRNLPTELSGLPQLQNLVILPNPNFTEILTQIDTLEEEAKQVQLATAKISPDSRQEHYRNLIALYQKGENLALKIAAYEKVGNFLSDLAWYQLLSGQFTDSEQSVRRALALVPQNQSAQRYLPPALLLSGHYDEAKAVYLRLKGQNYTGSIEVDSYSNLLLQDLKGLDAAGIIPKQYLEDVDKIKQLLIDENEQFK